MQRDREAQALAGQDRRRADAHGGAAVVDERTAGVAGVEGGVRLHDVLDEPSRAGAQRAAERAHDAGGDRGLEAVRAPEGQHELAHAEPARVAARDRHEAGRVDAQDREVGVGVVADEARGPAAAVGQRDPDGGRSLHDVAVRQQEAVRRQGEAGAAALAAAAPGADRHVDDARGRALDGLHHRLRVRVERGRFRGVRRERRPHGALPLADGRDEASRLAGAQDRQREHLADAVRVEAGEERRRGRELLLARAQKYVAEQQPGACRRPVGLDRQHDEPRGLAEARAKVGR